MEPSDADSSPVPAAKSEAAPSAVARGATDATKVRRLIADQRYFGLDAQVFHRGAQQTLARVAAQQTSAPRTDARGLGEDFRLEAAASWTLLRAMLAGGLLAADGPASYRITARFREYACAPVIMPLTRASARGLIERARDAAGRINALASKNPYRIRSILVAGSYMSRSARVPDISLWLLLRRRPEAQSRHRSAPLSKSDAMRQIVATMKALSSFIIVHLVSEREDVPRPFSVVYDADEDFDPSGHSSWGRFRQWGASISRRLSLK